MTPDDIWDALEHPKMTATALPTADQDAPVLDAFPGDPASLDDDTVDTASQGIRLQDDANPRPADVDLRNHDQVLNQGPVGSCTAHAVAGAMNLGLDERMNGQSKQISAQHLWYLQGHRADVVASIQTAEKYWIDTAAAWPNRANSQPAGDLTAGAYAAISGASQLRTLQSVVDALRAGKPIVVASKLLDSWRPGYMRSDGIINADAAASSNWQHAYHAYAVAGFHIDKQGRFQDWNGGYLIVKNSWGPNWGDHGYAYMPFNYCSKMAARYRDGYCSFYTVDGVITKDGQ